MEGVLAIDEGVTSGQQIIYAYVKSALDGEDVSEEGLQQMTFESRGNY
jgi:hypothetical protein